MRLDFPRSLKGRRGGFQNPHHRPEPELCGRTQPVNEWSRGDTDSNRFPRPLRRGDAPTRAVVPPGGTRGRCRPCVPPRDVRPRARCRSPRRLDVVVRRQGGLSPEVFHLFVTGVKLQRLRSVRQAAGRAGVAQFPPLGSGKGVAVAVLERLEHHVEMLRWKTREGSGERHALRVVRLLYLRTRFGDIFLMHHF